MTARFRIIHYLPDPISGARVPIAALVADGARLSVVRSRFTPGAACVGGVASWHNMQMILEELMEAEHFDRLPSSLGPQVVLSAQHPIPATVENPTAWVERCILPQSMNPKDAEPKVPHVPRRAAMGFQFFKTWKVARYVERNFKATDLGLSENLAHKITHYVAGRSELLLMEPMVARGDFGQELRDVSEGILAWQRLFELHGRGRPTPRFVTYIFSEGHKPAVAQARETFAKTNVEVVDIETVGERGHLLGEIKRVGETRGLPNLH